MKNRILFAAFIFLPLLAFSQEKIVQFNGHTVDEYKESVPFVYIINFTKKTLNSSDAYGYFNIPMEKTDTLVIRAMGYRSFKLTIPEDLEGDSPYMDIVLENDTLMIGEVLIKPWMGNYERFKTEVVNYDPGETDYDRAMKNLESIDYAEYFAYGPPDPSINYKNNMKLYADQLYYAGQAQPITITNPLAWAKFFKALKEGLFKNDNKKEKN